MLNRTYVPDRFSLLVQGEWLSALSHAKSKAKGEAVSPISIPFPHSHRNPINDSTSNPSSLTSNGSTFQNGSR